MTDFAQRRLVMVDTQVRPSDVTKFPIIEAMLHIPREDFVPAAQREAAYLGENLPLGQGRVLLEPRTLAKMLDVLAIGRDEMVLLIGSGLGYSAAIVAHMAEAVVAVEEDETMAAEAQAAWAAVGADNIAQHIGPMTDGAAKHGAYDVIVIEGGITEVPQQLIDQLKEGGRIAALFMEGPLGEVRLGHKRGGLVSWRMEFNAGAPILPGFDKKEAFQF